MSEPDEVPENVPESVPENVPENVPEKVIGTGDGRLHRCSRTEA